MAPVRVATVIVTALALGGVVVLRSRRERRRRDADRWAAATDALTGNPTLRETP